MASRTKDKDQIQQDFLPFGPLGKKAIFSKANQIIFAFFISFLIICIVFSPVRVRYDHTYHKFSFKLT